MELSNLPRQTLYETADIARKKAEAAKDRLEEMNPGVKIATHLTRLDTTNAEALIKNYDVVVDGTDNFDSRYAINDACLKAKTPWVHAAMLGYIAHVSTFTPHMEGCPCYRCYAPEKPERERSCAQEGIIAPLAGIVGNFTGDGSDQTDHRTRRSADKKNAPHRCAEHVFYLESPFTRSRVWALAALNIHAFFKHFIVRVST